MHEVDSANLLRGWHIVREERCREDFICLSIRL